jgi:hypothetical protein
VSRKTRTALLLIIGILGFSSAAPSCAISRALYLGDDPHARDTGPRPSVNTGEDINGLFPRAVYIKTRTQTFNSYHYYILREGRIWYKSVDSEIDPEKGPKDWTLFTETGLPHNPWKIGFNKPERIVELSADADELVALSAEGGFYRYCFDRTIAHKSKVWLDRQGWPGEEQLYLDPRAAGNLSWAIGKRNPQVLYYEDPFGNQHHNGTQEIVTTYVLLEDGQEICYADTGLPGDFSRNYLGPERGTFKAAALSASASTMFVINHAGEMYTRLADFDTIGCDPMFFKYTYVPYTSDLPGTDYFSNLNEWGLPAEDWRPQPPIPLKGKAAITRHITILQNGQGNGARELRVAGLNGEGDTGYWTKAIFDEAWTFVSVPLYFEDGAVLRTAEPPGDNPPGARGPSLDKRYSGYYWDGAEKEDGWKYTIPNFNILEGDCDFEIRRGNETCVLKLYPVEMWTYHKRDYLPGRSGSPKMFFATLEIPPNALEGLSAEFAAELSEKYAKNHRRLFHYTIQATEQYILMGDAENKTLFLTDGILPDHYPAFQQTWQMVNYKEIERCFSPELTIRQDTPVSGEELRQKTAANKIFRDELRYQIRQLKWLQLTAFKFNFGYIPAHYIAKITPLRFFDLPKIRTVTEFGEQIILENSDYIYSISDLRIWMNEKLIGLVELRLRYYQDLSKEPSNPPEYSENIESYWDTAGLPRTIPGALFSPERKPLSGPKPAVLSLVPARGEPGLFGWYFNLGASSIFIDPLKSAETIYSRGGKTPAEQKIQLDGVLYLNTKTNTPELELLRDWLDPDPGEADQSIGIRISFDGQTFEIREHPARHSKALIFRGNP